MLTTSSRRVLQNSIKNIRSITTTASSTASQAAATATTKTTSLAQKWALITTTTATGLLTMYTLHQACSSKLFKGDDDNAYKSLFPVSNTACEVVMIGPIKEKSSGILFPQLCNGMQFVGCGVRVKYGFVKV